MLLLSEVDVKYKCWESESMELSYNIKAEVGCKH